MAITTQTLTQSYTLYGDQVVKAEFVFSSLRYVLGISSITCSLNSGAKPYSAAITSISVEGNKVKCTAACSYGAETRTISITMKAFDDSDYPNNCTYNTEFAKLEGIKTPKQSTLSKTYTSTSQYNPPLGIVSVGGITDFNGLWTFGISGNNLNITFANGHYSGTTTATNTALFGTRYKAVTLELEAQNGGNVSSNLNVPAGSTVTASASEGSAYKFTGWYSDSARTHLVSKNYDYTFTINSNTKLYAGFKVAKWVYLYPETTPFGTITGAGKYAEGETVTIKCTPASGYNFTGWYKDEKLLDRFTGTNPYTFTLNDNVTLYCGFGMGPNILFKPNPKSFTVYNDNEFMSILVENKGCVWYLIGQ